MEMKHTIEAMNASNEQLHGELDDNSRDYNTQINDLNDYITMLEKEKKEMAQDIIISEGNNDDTRIELDDCKGQLKKLIESGGIEFASPPRVPRSKKAKGEIDHEVKKAHKRAKTAAADAEAERRADDEGGVDQYVVHGDAAAYEPEPPKKKAAKRTSSGC